MFGLYHTPDSLVSQIDSQGPVSFEIQLLKGAIKKGEFDNSDLRYLNETDINACLAAIDHLLKVVVERRRKLDINSLRYKFAHELLLARGLVALPLLLFLNEESELFNPNLTLRSVGIELTLINLRGQLQNISKKPVTRCPPCK